MVPSLPSFSGGFGGLSEVSDDLAHHDRHISQDGGDGLASEGLFFPKQYLDGNFNILGVFGVLPWQAGIVTPHRDAVVFEHIEGSLYNDEVGHARVDVVDIQTVKTNSRPDGHDELVLIGNIENMKSIQKVVSARIRLQVAEFLSDFFAGDLYLSISQNRFKTLRLSAKRELYLIGGGVVRSQDIPSEVIQGGAQIVDRVTDDEREMIGNGRVYIGDQGALAGLSVVLDGKPAAIGVVQSLRLGNKVLDVMLGPL